MVMMRLMVMMVKVMVMVMVMAMVMMVMMMISITGPPPFTIRSNQQSSLSIVHHTFSNVMLLIRERRWGQI